MFSSAPFIEADAFALKYPGESAIEIDVTNASPETAIESAYRTP
jgi:hypothetical protein